MNTFTKIVAMFLFAMMAGTVQADDMASEDGMMGDDTKDSMEHQDMTKDGMSGDMDHGMKDNDMSDDNMGMKDDGKSMKDDNKAMHNEMKDGGMGKSDSMQ